MNDEELFQLFIKYIRNQATEKEAIAFLQTIATGKASIMIQAYMKAYRQADLSVSMKEEISNDVYERIQSCFKEQRPIRDRTRPGVLNTNVEKALLKKRRPFVRYWKAAAVLLVLFVSVTLLTYLLWNPGRLNQSGHKVTRSASIAGIENARKLIQPSAYTQSLVLEDHSSVVVRSGSSLGINQNFNDSLRSVYLDGEAFFDVAHNDRKPFLIHTGPLTIEVLGTAFNIKAYSSQDSALVYVTRGKVLVWDQAHKLNRVLNVHQSIVYQKGQSSFIVQDQDNRDKEILNWTNQDMVFNRLTMRQIFDKLSRRYNVTILSEDSTLLNTRVKISFNGTESLQNVMEALAIITESGFQLQKDTLNVFRKGNALLENKK